MEQLLVPTPFLPPVTSTPPGTAPSLPPGSLNATPPVPSAGSYTPESGPTRPWPADVSELLRALCRLPPVQQLSLRVRDGRARQLRALGQEWDSASTGQRAIMVGTAAIVAGSQITPILANQLTREIVFNVIQDRDIPVPQIRGTSLRIHARGAGAGFPIPIPPVPGVSASVDIQTTDYEFHIN